MPKINPEALKAIRERDGQTQVDLAAGSGIAQSQISRIEREPVDVRPATAKALADALKVPVSALLLVEEPA